MNREQLGSVIPGLYWLNWKSGGRSLAAVGILYDGTRWFAPTNWTCELSNPGGVVSTKWRLVDSVTLLFTRRNGELVEH